MGILFLSLFSFYRKSSNQDGLIPLLDPSDRSRLDHPVNLPSPGADEELPVSAMVTVAGDGREWMAAVCGQWRRRSFPSLLALDLDRVGVFGGEPGNAVNLVVHAAGPHLFM